MTRRLGFTDARVKALKTEATRYDVHDHGPKHAPGLVVTVRPEGSKVYYLVKKINGHVVRYRIARTDELSVEKARKRATVLTGEIAGGGDPVATRRKMRAEMSLGELWTLYLEKHGKHKRSASADEWRYKKHLQGWQGRKVATITRGDAAALLAKITANAGPIAANRVRALAHSIFAKAAAWGLEIANPFQGTSRNPEHPKSRYLAPEELQRFWKALGEEWERDTRDALRLLLLTGVRSGTLVKAQWSEFDLAEKVWRIPALSMKAGRELNLPIAPRVVEILRERRADNPEAVYVFPSVRTSTGHLATIPREGWTRVLAAAKVADLTPHDLRRTHATYGLGAGVPVEVLSRVLGHTIAGGITANVYAMSSETLARMAVEKTVTAILAVAEAPDAKSAAKVLKFEKPAWAREAV